MAMHCGSLRAANASIALFALLAGSVCGEDTVHDDLIVQHALLADIEATMGGGFEPAALSRHGRIVSAWCIGSDAKATGSLCSAQVSSASGRSSKQQLPLFRGFCSAIGDLTWNQRGFAIAAGCQRSAPGPTEVLLASQAEAHAATLDVLYRTHGRVFGVWVASSESGGWVIWQEAARGSIHDLTVRGVPLTSAGRPAAAARPLILAGQWMEVGAVDLGVLPDGRAAIAYRAPDPQQHHARALLLALVRPDEVTSTVVRVSEAGAADPGQPRLAISPAGIMALVWKADGGVWLRRFAPDGSPLEPHPFRVDAAERVIFSGPHLPSIAVVGRSAAVLWHSASEGMDRRFVRIVPGDTAAASAAVCIDSVPWAEPVGETDTIATTGQQLQLFRWLRAPDNPRRRRLERASVLFSDLLGHAQGDLRCPQATEDS